MKKTLFAAILSAAFLLAFIPTASANEYDRGESDYWFRYVAYVLHPVGVALEYTVARPIHWLVSQPDLHIWFGHEPTEDISYDYFEWE